MSAITIVIDTREKEPYHFDSSKINVVYKALKSGDYSLLGWEDQVAIERKSLADFVNTVIRGRKRFYHELSRLTHYKAACVVVEGQFRDLLEGRYTSDAHPQALLGYVFSIMIDFGIPVYFCSDRQASVCFVQGYLIRFHQRNLIC